MSSNSQIVELIVQWEEAQAQGINLDLELLCAEDPLLLEQLKLAINKIQRLQWMLESPKHALERTEQSLIGRLIANRYAVESLVGRGGFGYVYRCYDQVLQRTVAIKVSRYEAGASNKETDRGREPGNLIREAQRAGKLRHPNIVVVHDVIHEENGTFIVSDYIDGPSLAKVTGLSMAQAIEIVAQVADAASFAHSNGVIHCDIKPENILISHLGTALLTDFGISRLSLDSSPKVMGTFGYMAPELLESDSTDEAGNLPTEKCDIWALGVVFYRLLDNPKLDSWFPERFRLPLSQPTLPQIDIAESDRNCFAKVQPIVISCLQPDPFKRMASAQLLATSLRSVLQSDGESANSRRVFIRNALLTSGAIAGCAGLAATLYRTKAAENSDGLSVGGEALPSTNPSSALATGLEFDGELRIVTPVARFAPCTVELWVKPSADDATAGLIGSDVIGEYGLAIGLHQGQLYVESLSTSSAPSAKIPSGKWTHIAACFDTDETRLYVDGVNIYKESPTAIFGDTPFAIGALSPTDTRYALKGQMLSARISQGGRYTTDFTPAETFVVNEIQTDASTVLLYDLSVNSTLTSLSTSTGLAEESLADHPNVPDLSGKSNHGRLVRIKPNSLEPVPKQFTFTFHGGTAISTPISRFAPSTLEAWILPFGYDNPCSFIFGSDEPTKYGLGLALCGEVLGAEYLAGMITSKNVVPVRKWSHVAVVFGSEKTTLFLEGNIVAVGPPTNSGGEEKFVLGRLSTNQVRDQFFGQIRTVRISRSERYSEAFEPDQVFTTDSNTTLIYQGDFMDGSKVIDLSGNANHGTWI